MIPKPSVPVLQGTRVLLRPWTDADLAPFAAMNADAAVMQHFPATLSRAESDQLASRVRAHFEQYGFGVWVLEIPGELAFAGCVGLQHVAFDAHFTPAVEIAWRLVRPAWGKHYATEAAECALRYAFEVKQFPEIVSFTVPANLRSQAVMQRLRMHSKAEDNFTHPKLAAGHPLSTHVLYRLRRDEWAA
ncbi:acetyltranferase, GNAT family [Janthinobacterium sp. Marseille]|nr:GNAT family N-acetyltransferase [Janthinobacterium sp. Marseille]ABR90420.1 acetyltranferase, GNAT family [Janthinobacterium sp. Marseille]